MTSKDSPEQTKEAMKITDAPFFVVSSKIDHEARIRSGVSIHCNNSALGHVNEGLVWMQPGMKLSGVVCAAQNRDTEVAVRRILAAYNEGGSETHVLVLHADHTGWRRVPCPLVDRLGSQTEVIVSSHSLESSQALYQFSGRVRRLGLNESDISLRQVLALFTPQEGTPLRSNVTDTVRLILSQFGEKFELQRFNDLVEQETWNEEESNFIALRQSLLASVLSDEGSVHSSQNIIVHLGDPLLYGTGIEATLMDMIVHRFLVEESKTRKLIILYNAQQYLKPGSILCQTLEHVASSGNDDDASVLIATDQPELLSATIYNSLDYLICGSTQSRAWRRVFDERLSLTSSLPNRGKMMIWCPGAKQIKPKESSTQLITTDWEDYTMFMSIQDLQKSMPAAPVHLNQSDEEEGIVPLPKAANTGLNSTLQASRTPIVTTTRAHTPLVPSPEESPVLSPKDVSSSSDVPPRFQFLVVTLQAAATTDADPFGWISYETTRGLIGTNKVVKSLGFSSFRTLIRLAAEMSIIETTDNHNLDRSSIRLYRGDNTLPTGESEGIAQSQSSEEPTASGYRLSDFPEEHRTVVKSLMRISEDGGSRPVSLSRLMDDLCQLLGGKDVLASASLMIHHAYHNKVIWEEYNSERREVILALVNPARYAS